MSKQIKQMEMDALKKTFADVREYALLSVTGLDCTADGNLRANLRKKKVQVQMVKNSLARRVFGELGITVPEDSPYWKGTTWMTWGPESVAELCKAINGIVDGNKVYDAKVTKKGAITEGQPVPWEVAEKLPTRLEAIGAIVAAIIGPASQIASQLTGPASQIASQIEKKGEDKGEEKPAEPPAA